MSKIEIRKILSSIKSAERRLEKVQARIRKLKDESEKEIDRRFRTTIDDIKSQIKAAGDMLASASKWKVGDHIRRVGGDGIATGNVYQVTRVLDHERFYARLITKKGVLGETTELFNTRPNITGHYVGGRWHSGPDAVVRVGVSPKDKKAL